MFAQPWPPDLFDFASDLTHDHHVSLKWRISIAVAVCLLVVYGLDDLSLRFHIPKSRQPFGTVTVHRYDAISEKNNKVEFVYEDPVNVTCVRSAFPHLGYTPCWYLARHSEQRINY
jgi:hypothetical protein